MHFDELRRELDNPIALVCVLGFFLMLIVLLGLALDAFLKKRKRERRRHNYQRAARESIRRHGRAAGQGQKSTESLAGEASQMTNDQGPIPKE